MSRAKTKHFTTYSEVVVAVDNRLVSPEACRFAELYHRGKRVLEKRRTVEKEKENRCE